MLILPATPQSVAGFVAAAAAAPRSCRPSPTSCRRRPMPFIPEALHGRLIILASLLHSGDAEAGARAIAPFRSIAEPLMDMLAPVAYADLFPPERRGRAVITEVRTLFLDHVGEAEAATMLEAPPGVQRADVRGPDPRPRWRRRARALSMPPRSRTGTCPIMLAIVAVCGGPEDRATQRAWATGLAAAARPGRARRLRGLHGRRGAGAPARRRTRARPGIACRTSRRATTPPTSSAATPTCRPPLPVG